MISNIFKALLMLSIPAVASSAPVWGAQGGTVDQVMADLMHRDAQVRLSALETIERNRDVRAVKALMDILGNQAEDWKLRIRVIRLLAEIGDPRAADALMNALGDYCPAIKWNATVALGRFSGSPRVVRALIDMLDDHSTVVREAAVASLGAIGDAYAVPQLIEALKDRTISVVLSALRALENIGDERALTPVRAIAEGHADPLLRSVAASVAEKISKEVISPGCY
ncbi:MAG: HEAT repeat domain-containing protein [Nitrospirota bacterium]